MRGAKTTFKKRRKVEVVQQEMERLKKEIANLREEITKRQSVIDFVGKLTGLLSHSKFDKHFEELSGICIPSKCFLNVLREAEDGIMNAKHLDKKDVGILTHENIHVLPKVFTTICKECCKDFAFTNDDRFSFKRDEFKLIYQSTTVFAMSYLRYACLRCTLKPPVLGFYMLPLPLRFLCLDYLAHENQF
jgi:hypothetical protein